MQDAPRTRELFEVCAGEIYAFREAPFTLASGMRSHHYFNCKKITLVPERLRLLALVLRDELIPSLNFPGGLPRAAGGLTLGSDPIAYALSLAYQEIGVDCYPVVVRKEAKQHGTGRRIEGEWPEGAVQEVLLIDDVITTGGSSLKAVHALREAGLKVTQGVCIVDREEGGRENLAAEGVELFAVFQKRDFARPGDGA